MARRLLMAAVALAVLGAKGARAQKIDSIVVLNEDVFAEEEEQNLPFLAKVANAVHVRTRAAAIRRTLLLNQGDAFDSARVVESERALRNLGVFRQVALDTAWVGDRLFLLVVTGDGWSTRPQISFSTAAGDETWNLGVVEENFLGTATQVGLSYYHNVDRSALELTYRNPHFIARRAVLFARYSDLSDGTRGVWRAGFPFVQTAGRRALETSGEANAGRVLVFRDGALNDSLDQRLYRFNLRGGLALHATSRDYVRAWLVTSVRREDYAAEAADTMARSISGSLGFGLDFGHARYRIVRRFNSYARREDLDLSSTARIGLWIAPTAWGYASDRAGVGPELYVQGSAVWSRGFIKAWGSAHGIFNNAGLDSGRANAALTIGSQLFSNQSFILHAEASAAHKPAPGYAYDFSFDRTGPRLFATHAFTGTRLFWATFEDRIVIDDDFYGMLGVGIAPFVDWGGAWYTDEDARSGGNVGLAIRLGPTRAIQGDPAEISFGVRWGDGVTSNGRWALTIRKALRF